MDSVKEEKQPLEEVAEAHDEEEEDQDVEDVEIDVVIRKANVEHLDIWNTGDLMTVVTLAGMARISLPIISCRSIQSPLSTLSCGQQAHLGDLFADSTPYRNSIRHGIGSGSESWAGDFQFVSHMSSCWHPGE